MIIPSKSSCQLEFFGFSAQPGQLEEHFVCTLGGGVKAKHVVFDFDVRCVVLSMFCTCLQCSAFYDLYMPPMLYCNMSCAV